MRPEIESCEERENRRRSTSWASPTTVGNGTRPEPSPSGASAKTRMAAKLKAIKGELHRRVHDRPAKTGAWLRSVVVGYYRYHAVQGNLGQLSTFRQRVNRLWHQAL